MKKFNVFLLSWIVSTIFAYLLVFGLAWRSMGESEFMRHFWLLLTPLAVFIGFLGGIIVVLLSYRREFRLLREFLEFFEREFTRAEFQDKVNCTLTRLAIVGTKAEQDLSDLYNEGVKPAVGAINHSKAQEMFANVERSRKYQASESKRQFEHFWDLIRRLDKVYPHGNTLHPRTFGSYVSRKPASTPTREPTPPAPETAQEELRTGTEG